MRSHAVTTFPDPDRFGNFTLNGSVIRSPSFQGAENACAKLLPGGNAAATDANTAATLQRDLTATKCMRAHGISDFPDPRTGVEPPSPGRAAPGTAPGTTVFENGVSFALPTAIDIQSPLFTHAASICHLSYLFSPSGN
ncbi:MAG: hypothetical protein ACRDLP_16350 [Solirubrobacteraceae bacterium]